MSKQHTLSASVRLRSGSGALKQMRREGFTPAVIYGATQENVNIKIVSKPFTDLLHASASENILVNIDIEGVDGGAKLALIQDVQHDPITKAILHADFHAVNQNDEIHATIPLNFTGTPAGVKNGGLLQQQVHDLEVHCLPKDLPEMISADVSALEMNDLMRINELTLPEGVTLTLAPDIIVALISEPRVIEEDEETTAAAPAEGAAPEAAEGEEKAAE